MYVYEIRTDNGRAWVDILVPGLDTLLSLPLDDAKRFAGDLTAEVGRHELPGDSPTLSPIARKALVYAHRQLELNSYPPTLDDIAEYVGISRRTLKRGALRELEAKGWYSHGLGHRDGSWGGSYKRPLKPPFSSSATPRNGQLRLVSKAA